MHLMKTLAFTLVAASLCVLVGCSAPNDPSRYGVDSGGVDWLDEPNSQLIAQRGRETGFKWVRVWINWEGIGRRADGHWDFGHVSQRYQRLVSEGYSLILVLSGSHEDLPGEDLRDDTARKSCNKSIYSWAQPPARVAGDARAQHFYGFARDAASQLGHLVAAFELWNEPNTCRRWQGTKQDYKDLVLAPGYYGIKDSGQIPGYVVAPATAGGFDKSWVEMSNSNRNYVVPLDYVSFHSYGSVATTKARMNNMWTYFTSHPNLPAKGYWLTEFGHGTTKSNGNPSFNDDVCGFSSVNNPGAAATSIYSHCRAFGACNKIFYFTLSDHVYDNRNGFCDVGIFDVDGNPTSDRKGRRKADAIRADILEWDDRL